MWDDYYPNVGRIITQMWDVLLPKCGTSESLVSSHIWVIMHMSRINPHIILQIRDDYLTN